MENSEKEKNEAIEKAAEKLAEIFVEHINFERANKSVIKKAVGVKQPQPAETDDLYKK